MSKAGSVRGTACDVLRSNTHTWHHVNLQGEYDFSEESPMAVLFDLEKAPQVRKGLELEICKPFQTVLYGFQPE